MPAAGKTTLADQLAVVLRAQGREVIRASIEGFLLPRSQRYRRGEDFCRRLLSRQLRLRRAAPGPARSAGPGRRPKVPAGGLRHRHGHRTVPAGHDGTCRSSQTWRLLRSSRRALGRRSGVSLEDVRLDLAGDEFSVVCESLRRIRERPQVLACSTTPGGSMRFLPHVQQHQQREHPRRAGRSAG